MVARALTITVESQQQHRITIKSNYGDVVTGTQAATMTSGGTSTSWQDLGNNLQARVTTSFPQRMSNLRLTPDATNDRVTISGTRSGNVSSTTLTVVIRDRTYTNVTKSFTVVVSGSGRGTALTIGTITP